MYRLRLGRKLLPAFVALPPSMAVAFALLLTAAAAKAAGGTVAREAAQFGASGIFIAFVVDPERQPHRAAPARARAALST